MALTCDLNLHPLRSVVTIPYTYWSDTGIPQHRGDTLWVCRKCGRRFAGPFPGIIS